MSPGPRPALVVAAAAALPLLAGAAGRAPAAPLDFNRDVRPLLSKYCFECHGPDAESREAGLRLDTREGATADLGGYAALIPGDVDGSEFVYRLRTDDREDRMPPEHVGRAPSPDEVETLVRWVAEGAPYAEHWAFVPPTRPELPRLTTPGAPATPDAGSDRLRTAVDAFVLARLEAEGLDYAPPADRRTLLRRAALDLTGLPPEPELLAAFLADDAPGAWERALDALLASPRYGERMAGIWLDLARYADTNGYHIDNVRFMWPWRDHLIAAWNANQPYDAFTVEALAGDLLPDATRAQKVASGFHRNHMINFEGGAIAEEYRNEYVVDRVNTTGKVWLGLTLGCAQCHDHKYDPLSQREYYELYAYFNNIDEKGLDGQQGNADPKLRVPDAAQERALAELDARVAAAEAELGEPGPEALAALRAWCAERDAALRAEWQVRMPVAARSDHEATSFQLADGLVTASGAPGEVEDYVFEFAAGDDALRLLRIEVPPGPDGVEFPRGGRAGNGNWVLSEAELEEVRGGEARRVPLADALGDHAQPGYPSRYAVDGDPATGWAADAHNERTPRVLELRAAEDFGRGADALRLTLRFRYGMAHSFARMRFSFSGAAQAVAAAAPPEYATWNFAVPKEEEIAPWSERPDFVDGEVHNFEGENTVFHLAREIVAGADSVRLWSLGSDDGIEVSVDGRTLLAKDVARPAAADQELVVAPLSAGVNHLLLLIHNLGGPGGFYFRDLGGVAALPGPVLDALRRRGAEAGDEAAVRTFFLERHWEPWAAKKRALDALKAEHAALLATIPTVMVMRERAMPRPTHLLHRGQYDQPREQLQAALPAALSPKPAPDRLALAQWMVDPRHPLTARVQVNRLWAMLFGEGLVRTQEDFGAQGEWPSHPELLDWLAVEYVDSGWDTKALLKLIASSAAYRQSSAATPELLARDPANRLLARGPRFRLSAEQVRDQALAASGLLVEKLGGPSVRPYQPPGLWREVAYGGGNSAYSGGVFEQDHGDDLYRRSLYTFRKRSAPPPQLTAFDAPNREACVVQRSRTNTPLQALVLMNDPTYVEAARVLAARVMAAEPGSRQRAELLYEAVLCRPATRAEAAILLEAVAERWQAYAADPAAAEELLAVGEWPRAEGLDAVEHAAWTCAAMLVLNLDETVTRG